MCNAVCNAADDDDSAPVESVTVNHWTWIRGGDRCLGVLTAVRGHSTVEVGRNPRLIGRRGL